MSRPLLPPVAAQSPLPNNAAAPAQLGRLLDALLVLDADGSCSITDLATRVGLQPGRLRELLSSFMVAACDAVGPEAPFNILFGTASGPLDADTDYDDDQAEASHVFRASPTMRDERVSLVDDVGLKPVTVDQIAAALLTAQALLDRDTLDERHRLGIQVLVAKLKAALHMSLTAPVDAVAHQLRDAARDRQRVSFHYHDPLDGEPVDVTVEPYDVRRRRDRIVLDAGPDIDTYRTFDVSAVTGLTRMGERHAFEPPRLPPRDERDRPVDVVLRVPVDSPAHKRLTDGWQARAVGGSGDGYVDVAISVDRPAGPRLGVLLLQLGPGCTVVSPESLRDAAGPVAERILVAHPA